MASQRISDTAEPAFLKKLELTKLACDASILVALSATYSIQWVNPGWERFARENDGAAILRRP